MYSGAYLAVSTLIGNLFIYSFRSFLLNKIKGDVGDDGDVKGVCFHQDMKSMEMRYQGK